MGVRKAPPDTGSWEVPSAEIQTQLERILGSRSFVHAERLSRFLRFAVDQALQGHGSNLKEYVIGTAVFDRNGSYDPRSDPIVRVEAGRLRSKLKEFYEGEGREDPVLISFQKGSYVPVFQRREAPAGRLTRMRSWIRLPTDWKTVVLAGASLFAVIAIYQAIALSRQNQALRQELEAARAPLDKEFAPIWGRFFLPRIPAFVVFGSPMFFASPRHSVFLRRGDLNDPPNLLNDPNFRALQERFGPLSGPRYDYAEMGEAIALQRLTAFFGRAGHTLTALPAHVAAWDSLKDGNLILLGTPRMNPLLRRLQVQRDFEWGPDHNVYNRNPQPGEQKIYTTPSHRDSLTYAVIASFPGLRPNRETLLLTAHSAPGTLAGVDFLTRPETARSLSEKLQFGGPGKPKYYEVLLRVLVDNNSPVKTEYVTHHWIGDPASK